MQCSSVSNRNTSYTVTLSAIHTPVTVTRKRMRTLRLRVTGGGDVLLSVPLFTPEHEITSFLQARQNWIAEVLARRAVDQQAARENDAAAPLKAAYNAMSPAERRIKALQICTESLKRVYPLAAPYGIPEPPLKIRQMKSLWGSYNRRTGAVTLNTALLCAPARCVDYVVLHELTHYLYMDHGPEFHAFIARLMPDYKERRHTLDRGIGIADSLK